jgi:hypothetical protein
LVDNAGVIYYSLKARIFGKTKPLRRSFEKEDGNEGISIAEQQRKLKQIYEDALVS